MRLNHNKKRNTAFVYEALVRELTKSVVKNNRNKQNKIVLIMREHFDKNSSLKEELDLYKSIYETKEIEKQVAEKIVLEAKKRHSELDKKKIFKEQSALINKINKTLSNKIFTNFVPNYRNIASVYSIFNDKLPVKDRVLLECNIVEQMSSSVEIKSEMEQKPIDNLVYGTFVEKFNKEYSKTLNEEQKVLLTHYISSFADNGLEFKAYLSEEIGRLKTELLSFKLSSTMDDNINEKVEKVHSVLENFKNEEVSADTLEAVLKTQKLVNEIKENDSIS